LIPSTAKSNFRKSKIKKEIVKETIEGKSLTYREAKIKDYI
jgi:hypothetical protein